MLYHKKCGNLLRAEISPDAVKLLASFSLTGKFTAQVNNISLHRTGVSKIPLIYYCVKCNKNVTEEDDEFCFMCSSCGKEFDLESLRIPQDSGGVYCEDCVERFSTEEKIYSFNVKDIKV